MGLGLGAAAAAAALLARRNIIQSTRGEGGSGAGGSASPLGSQVSVFRVSRVSSDKLDDDDCDATQLVAGLLADGTDPLLCYK